MNSVTDGSSTSQIPARYGDYRDSHLNAGPTYASFVAENDYVKLLWAIEQRALSDIVAARFGRGAARHLDFACGTGRIVQGLQGVVKSSVGVDVSMSMVQMARRTCPEARFILADLSQRDPFSPGIRFDLITAFRFFLNAEPDLRARVLASLGKRLAPGGVLILNVHRNYGSCTYRMLRAAGRSADTLRCMRDEEVHKMLRTAGLVVVDERHAGILPATEQRTFVPMHLMMPIENALARFAPLRHLANDRVYVCAHR